MPRRSGPVDKGAVGTYIHGRALVCGGFNRITYNNSALQNQCWEMDPVTKTWVHAEYNMLYERDGAAAAQMLPDDDWLVTGGWDYKQDIVQNSTEMLSMGQGFVKQPEMLRTVAMHNLVRINGTQAMALSEDQGGPGTNMTYIFNREEWVVGPEMLFPVSGSQAAYVKLHFDQDKEGVLVAGGFYGEKRSQLYNVEDGRWYLQGNLPFDIHRGASVSFNNTMIIVGGDSKEIGTHLNTLVIFNRETSRWEVMEQRLKRRRELSAAFLIPDNLVSCSIPTTSPPTTITTSTTTKEPITSTSATTSMNVTEPVSSTTTTTTTKTTTSTTSGSSPLIYSCLIMLMLSIVTVNL